jgi:hypothetical protein
MNARHDNRSQALFTSFAWTAMDGRGCAQAATAIECGLEYAGRALAIDDTHAAAHISVGGPRNATWIRKETIRPQTAAHHAASGILNGSPKKPGSWRTKFSNLRS